MINKDNLKTMREEMELALADIAKKYDCEINVGNCKYSNVTATFSVNFNANGTNDMSAEQNLFNTYCTQFGFKPEDYQKRVIMGDKDYRLVGFNLKARKNFCIIEKDGKQYVCSPEAVKPSLGRV